MINKDSINIFLAELDEIPHKKLSKEEELDLIKKIKNGDKKVYEWFVKNNLRLVLLIAKKYTKYGVSLEDLLGEGNLGLLKAIKTFDPSYGTEFSVFASIYIEGYIRSSINKHTRIVRLPEDFYNQVMKYKYYKKFNYTDEKIARLLNVDMEKIEKIKKYLDNIISINSVDNNGEEIGLKIKDDQNVEEIVYDKLTKEELCRIIESLDVSNIKKDVIYLRFGLKENKPLTQEEIASRVGVSRQRVNQIEKEVLALLRLVYEKGIKENREERTLKPKKPTIEMDFHGYTNHQIQEMLTRLTDIERYIFQLKYSKEHIWTEELDTEYNNCILPKIIIILEELKEKDEIININMLEFLSDEIIMEIAYKPTVEFIEIYKGAFKKMFHSKTMQEVLCDLPSEYSKILKSRLGINKNTYSKIRELSVEYNLYDDEVSNILYNILIKYKTKFHQDTKKRC